MKKNVHFYLILFLLLQLPLMAQTSYTAKFKDGTEVPFATTETRGDQLNMQWISVGMKANEQNVNGTYDAMFDFEYNYFLAGKFQAGAEMGLMGDRGLAKYGLNGTWYFKSFEKPGQLKITLRSTPTGPNERLVYKSKVDIVKNKYFGIVGGLTKKRFMKEGAAPLYWESQNWYYYFSKIELGELSLGLSYTGCRHIKYNVGGDKPYTGIQLNSMFRAKIDFITYPFNSMEYTAYKDSSGYSGPLIKDNSFISPFAIRLALDGRLSWTIRRDWGIEYSLGVIKTPFSEGSPFAQVSPLGGLGIYAAFGNPKNARQCAE